MMAEYIEREAVRSKAVYMHGFGKNKYVPLRAIEEALAADVRPAVKGSWRSVGLAAVKCSECGYVDDWKMYHRYCPDCGAFMR